MGGGLGATDFTFLGTVFFLIVGVSWSVLIASQFWTRRVGNVVDATFGDAGGWRGDRLRALWLRGWCRAAAAREAYTGRDDFRLVVAGAAADAK